MRTRHADYVFKYICPLCKTTASNKPNQRVYASRFHPGFKVKNDKLGGRRIKSTWIRSVDLVNGRYYEAISDSESSSSSDEDSTLPLSQLQQKIRRTASNDSNDLFCISCVLYQ